MAKAVVRREEDILTPEQVAARTGMLDIYFLAVPRETMESINERAKIIGLTGAQAISDALTDWLEKVGK